MKKVYGYIRVSTETQADKGYGLSTQENAIEKYCQDNNLELVQIFKDEGISGAMGDKDDLSYREGLTNLLATLNGTNTIVVMNTSRLWRDDSARVLICREVRKTKGEILSVEQPKYSLYSTDPHDFLFNSMMEILDQYERMTINIRLAKGKTTKAKTGNKPTGLAPFGYKWDYNHKFIEVDEKESEIVKLIYSLSNQGIGLTAIANMLNKQQYETRRGYSWSKQGIRAILRNNFYIGIVTHQGKEIQGKHQAIVDTSVWESVNKAS
ncbi:MAG: recombinase family protein [Oscillospiraceae bacterium]